MKNTHLCAFAPLREAFFVAFSLLIFSPALAQLSVSYTPLGDESANFRTQVLLTDLDNPAGLALLPTQAKSGPYELFFAESGAGRVVRFSTDVTEQVDEVVTGFPLGTFGQMPEYRVGPLGLAFLSRTKLVVGFKGESSGADTLASFSLPAQGTVLTAKEHEHAVDPLKKKLASQINDLQYGGLAVSGKTCFVTTGGKDSQGWVLRSGVEANRLFKLRPFIDLRSTVDLGGPAGIAIIPPPRPAYLVVSLMGSRETPYDSRLAFFVPSSRELVLNLATGLNDIISLVYSPTGQLYAADFSWHEEQSGGVYRIDDARLEGRQACRAVKIASLVRPFGLTFAPDGTLFVTTFGEGENTKQGTLVKITGEL